MKTVFTNDDVYVILGLTKLDLKTSFECLELERHASAACCYSEKTFGEIRKLNIVMFIFVISHQFVDRMSTNLSDKWSRP